MKRLVYDEQAIVQVTLPESVHEDIRCANVEKALHPSNFPGQTREMELVGEHLSGLTFFQRGLLTDALVLSLRESHGGRVAFSVQDCGYVLPGIGIEIRNDTVTESDDPRSPEERLQPMKVIFAVNRGSERMR